MDEVKAEIVVPDPEPTWGHALVYQGGNQNPAQQYFTFEQAIGDFHLISELKVNIDDVARRLRLELEPGHADQLGPVDAAFFAIRRIGFAVHRYGREETTLVSLHWKSETPVIEAVDVLLETLGVDWRAVATVVFGHGPTMNALVPTLDHDLRPTFPQSEDDAANDRVPE